MQSSGFKVLEDESRRLYKALQDMPTNAISYRDIQPIEEYICLLKKKSDFFASKLRVVHLTAAQATEIPPNKSYDVTENKLDFANEILRINMQEKEIKIAMLSSFLTSTLLNDTTDPKFLRYRQLVIEELKFARIIHENIQGCHAPYVRVIADNIKLKVKLIAKQIEYKMLLKEKTAQNAADYKQLMSESYIDDLDFMRLRINKINFVRILTMRLLIYGTHLGDNDLSHIVKKCRTPFTIESFL